LNGIKKQRQIVAKGHNETLEIVNSVEHTKAAKDVNSDHVPGNGGTCSSHFCIGGDGARIAFGNGISMLVGKWWQF
jgi:hypothetical protein